MGKCPRCPAEAETHVVGADVGTMGVWRLDYNYCRVHGTLDAIPYAAVD